jgi:hypothetical protein
VAISVQYYLKHGNTNFSMAHFYLCTETSFNVSGHEQMFIKATKETSSSELS